MYNFLFYVYSNNLRVKLEQSDIIEKLFSIEIQKMIQIANINSLINYHREKVIQNKFKKSEQLQVTFFFSRL